MRTSDRPASLPSPRTSFVGRDGELETTVELVHSTPLVTLVGAGGIGKTRLAIEAAGALRDAFDDGVWFVDLSGLRRGAPAAPAVAAALDAAAGARPASAEAVASHLRYRNLLLILDNCEHVVGPVVNLVEAILDGAPAVHVLATSRLALGIPGERVLAVAPLALPAEDRDAARLPLAPAIELLVERARAVRPGFAVTGDNAPALARIARLVDGLPLGLELAAARLATVEPAALAEGIAGSLDALRDDAAPIERHRTMRAIVEWSYNELTFAERALLRRLAVFGPTGWTLAGATAVAGPAPRRGETAADLLATLVAHSLVLERERDPGGALPRYRFLGVTYRFAEERFAGSDDEPFVRDLHAAHYRELAETRIGPHRTRDRWRDRAPYAIEKPNIRSALAWTLQGSGRRLDGVRLAIAAAPLWDHGPDTAEIEPFLVLAIDFAPDLERRAEALVMLATRKDLSGRHAEAREDAAQAVAIFRRSSNPFWLGRALMRLSSATHFCGRSGPALEYGREGLRYSDEAGDLAGRTIALLNLYVVASGSDVCSREVTDDLLQRTEEALRELDDDRRRVVLWTNAAYHLFRSGLPRRAAEAARRGCEIAQASGDASASAMNLLNLACYEVSCGDLAAGRRALLGALATYVAWNDEFGKLRCTEVAAYVAEATGRYGDAIALLAFAAAFREGRADYQAATAHFVQQQYARLRALADSPLWERSCERGRAMTLASALDLAALV